MEIDTAYDPYAVDQDRAITVGVKRAVHFAPAAAHPYVWPIDVEFRKDPLPLRLILLFLGAILRVHAQQQYGQFVRPDFLLNPLNQREFLNANVSRRTPNVEQEGLSFVVSK